MDWDEELSEELTSQHREWREQLPLLKTMHLPRCYFSVGKTSSTQLHGFSDASDLAFAAVVYLRATYTDGSVSCRLVVAKTRVAPLNKVSTPRLELCGAEMLAELLSITGSTLNIPVSNIHAWCDSTVALAWLRGSPSNYKVFVANRVASAARNLSPSAWQHVPTDQNPADCASRGLSAQELKNHNLWWEGPPWLHQEPIAIPPQPQASEVAKHQGLEAKPTAVYALTVSPVSWWEHNFKSYTKLLHATAYVFRFFHNLQAVIRNQSPLRDKVLSVAEVKQAESFLFKQSQARTYGAEVERLTSLQWSRTPSYDWCIPSSARRDCCRLEAD